MFVEAAEPVVASVLAFADYIKTETLAHELQDGGDFEWDKEVVAEVEGVEVKIAVRR